MRADAPSMWFEDFVPGETVSLGSRTVSADEIVAFARAYDPQPMHLDADSAQSPFLTGLTASGWHSCAILMRLMADGFLLNAASMGSPGVDEVRWLRPVRPGDTLSATRTVLDKRALRSRPDMGLVRFRFELVNQHGETVLVQDNPILFGRRAPGPAEGAAG